MYLKIGVIFSMFSFFAIVILEACTYCIEGKEDKPKQPEILNDQVDESLGDSSRLRVGFCVCEK